MLAAHPSRTRWYVWDFDTLSFRERIYEYDESMQTITRQWELGRINGVFSSFGFDFSRGRMYAGYFDQGHLEVFHLGDALGLEADEVLGNGAFRATGYGTAGDTWVFEASTNLTT